MGSRRFFTIKTALIVALGGFLMGFDASVISGVVRFIEPEFNLSKLQLGWAVSSLTLTSTLAMMIAGPLSNKYGRRYILRWAAMFYAVSAVASAVAPDFISLIIARMLGGFGVGASLIIAPMYIAEIAPPKLRGKLVSINQLNIVVGISVAFFTNFLILKLSASDTAWLSPYRLAENQWRWMLGVEALPALLYFGFLFMVPRSPRWLLLKGKDAEALQVLIKVSSEMQALQDIEAVKRSFTEGGKHQKVPFTEVFKPALRAVLLIGITVAVLQQITGINAVFFYAPMIFEQSGIGIDASFAQAILVGLTNIVFTVLAILFIDRFGRRILLLFGLLGIAISMLTLAWGFHNATYLLTSEKADLLSEWINKKNLTPLIGIPFENDIAFKKAISENFAMSEAKMVEAELLTAATSMNAGLVLLGIIAFVASFAISLGPVMWVLFSEIFPNYIRALAISFVGFINSVVSFLVQLVFPWELANLGNSITFLIFGLFALVGLGMVYLYIPETKNKSLEELEQMLIKK